MKIALAHSFGFVRRRIAGLLTSSGHIVSESESLSALHQDLRTHPKISSVIVDSQLPGGRDHVLALPRFVRDLGRVDDAGNPAICSFIVMTAGDPSAENDSFCATAEALGFHIAPANIGREDLLKLFVQQTPDSETASALKNSPSVGQGEARLRCLTSQVNELRQLQEQANSRMMSILREFDELRFAP